MEAQNLFANSRVNIIAEGKKHLGAVQNIVKNMWKFSKRLGQPTYYFCQLLKKHNHKQLIQ